MIKGEGRAKQAGLIPLFGCASSLDLSMQAGHASEVSGHCGRIVAFGH
jgi:hypothetical protein